MKFKHIVKEGEDLNTLNKHISEGKNAFILVYSDSCGYCVEVLPKWKKIEQILSTQYKNTDSVIVASVNVELSKHIPYFGKFQGVPSMKYIYDNGKKTETYEDSAVEDKNRETSSFVNWIEIKLDNHHSHIDKKKPPQKPPRKTRNKKNIKVGGKTRNKKNKSRSSYKRNKK